LFFFHHAAWCIFRRHAACCLFRRKVRQDSVWLWLSAC
jgi:hypothetical protein